MELPRARRAQSKPAASPRHLERAAGVGFVRGDGGTLFADATAWESLVVGDDVSDGVGHGRVGDADGLGQWCHGDGKNGAVIVV